MEYSVYILYSKSLNLFYKGQTNNLAKRLIRHNSGQENFTKKGLPWIVIWATTKENRSQAKILESKLKNLTRKRLIGFMIKYNDGFVSPYETRFIVQLSQKI